jgi:hypothetical protein
MKNTHYLVINKSTASTIDEGVVSLTIGEECMFDDDSPKEKEPVDYTGLKIVAILAPVFFVITYLANADMGLTVCIVLGVTIVAVKMHWDSRKHVWFWAIVVFVLALHIPLFRIVKWPQRKGPTLFYTMPLGIADFLIISGVLGLAEKLLSKDSSSNHGGL